MYHIKVFFALILLVLFTARSEADEIPLAVWANEAIVATYTYDYKNFIARQREIAKYFTASAWTAYSSAFQESKIPEMVQKNAYSVTSVATLPPKIKEIEALKGQTLQWEIIMPLRVLYRNPQYQEKQDLLVTIRVIPAASSQQGVRGLAIASFQSKTSDPPCPCGKPE